MGFSLASNHRPDYVRLSYRVFSLRFYSKMGFYRFELHAFGPRVTYLSNFFHFTYLKTVIGDTSNSASTLAFDLFNMELIFKRSRIS